MKPSSGKVVSGDLDDHSDPHLQIYFHIVKEEVLLQHFQIFGFIQMRSNKGQKEIKGKCLKNVLALEKRSLNISRCLSNRHEMLIFFGIWEFVLCGDFER